MSSPPILEARAVRKEFPGVLALDGVSLRLDIGEVLAVVGENGAGKSTLMKIVAGVYQPDAGEILINGQPVTLPDVSAAMRAGVSLIHQELNLAENLSVGANLFLGREPEKGGFLRLIDREKIETESGKLLARVGLPTDMVNVAVSTLAPGQKQLVEIARALSLQARVIIMDEPTSSLTSRETERLYEVIEALKRDGVGVLYISHRLGEVKRIADRVTVLRDGRNAGELAKEQISHDSLIRLMVGRDLKTLHPRKRGPAKQTRLTVRNLRYLGGPAPISFEVKAGEVLGMAGLVGAGRTELSEAIFGIREVVEGEILLDGKPIKVRRPGDAIDAGILLVPEDRRAHGLILPEGAEFNLALPNLKRLSHNRLISTGRVREMAQKLVSRLRVKTPNLRQPVGLLSGGNQQKVVFGKWLARDPAVLILDEPTRGVDVGAREEIYTVIDELASSGVAVWMISSDMEEILGMSDRVLVLHEGHLTGELSRSELGEEAIMRLATGGIRG